MAMMNALEIHLADTYWKGSNKALVGTTRRPKDQLYGLVAFDLK